MGEENRSLRTEANGGCDQAHQKDQDGGDRKDQENIEGTL
jgi:hypothetical protein